MSIQKLKNLLSSSDDSHTVIVVEDIEISEQVFKRYIEEEGVRVISTEESRTYGLDGSADAELDIVRLQGVYTVKAGCLVFSIIFHKSCSGGDTLSSSSEVKPISDFSVVCPASVEYLTCQVVDVFTCFSDFAG